LKLFQEARLSKESQLKAFSGITKQWTDVQKVAKDVKKEIEKDVQSENERNNTNIKNLEDDITHYSQELKKREFFQYKCGTDQAIEKLDGVFAELKDFEESIADLGENAAKFGNANQIEKARKDVEAIKVTIDNMKILWDHIEIC